jgi:hypothetical protein
MGNKGQEWTVMDMYKKGPRRDNMGQEGTRRDKQGGPEGITRDNKGLEGTRMDKDGQEWTRMSGEDKNGQEGTRMAEGDKKRRLSYLTFFSIILESC